MICYFGVYLGYILSSNYTREPEFGRYRRNVGVLQWRRGWDYLFDIPRRILPGVVFDGREVVLGEFVSG